ncbi:RsmB/NOP family class I SAM-dependent RNA methyltransferase [Commensalibacter oyaizuii]|uniref:RsmB/NOP family class I SAM-dependent RNA methyltransferase n=1 Tax=Commensalibacter oyaizuii TaxID=3043873 RepID=A0ABT6PZD2_9PROT|nr:RsmB/NOP family class I SAM-dependent RNA methyltransferase [Commensalibacter sp. TBRC 16381]MDI2090222.1 RsmB/NOP family class I SAM-dependent RNA methyltransferase [Commensalibacter sp. TBRC 16381]
MTPSAQVSAVIELLLNIQNQRHAPADATANRFFRQRRYIGGGDRRYVSAQIWEILRHYRKLQWWLKRVGSPINPRMMVSTFLVLSGQSVKEVSKLFSGEKYAPLPLKQNEELYLLSLEGKSFFSKEMPNAVKFEVPDWLYPLLEEQYADSIETELTALLEPAHLDLRVNTLKGDDRSTIKEKLKLEGIISTEMQFSPWGLRVEGRQSITSTNLFKEGDIEIQDEGSQLIALMTGATSQMRVLDFCAGAGGKTMAMAMMMQNKGHIIASDVSEVRLGAAQRRLRRAGAFNVETHQFVEGAKWIKRRIKSFDRVLVDAPCSGTGTWRRNPDARLKFRQIDLAELIAKQADILRSAATMVKEGGRLIYATCSLLQQENQYQIEQFLENHPDFHLVPPDTAEGLLPKEFTQHPTFQLTPAQYKTDGFFCAVLERKVSKVELS